MARTSLGGDLLWRRRASLILVLLALPLGWLLILYLAPLGVFMGQSFFAIDDFTGQIVREPTLRTFGDLLSPANLDILLRTVAIAAAATVLSACLAMPVALYAARYARGAMLGLFYLAVMAPLWSSYLVKIYGWKLMLAREGALTWLASVTGLSFILDAVLRTPSIGGPSLSASYLGMVLVFTYLWLPFMILPVQAALERVPQSLLDAAADLGANERRVFRTVILPLAVPGVAAGSIFTFSLTLGDYIVPQIIGPSTLILGQAVYMHQGTAGNIPLAAAFCMVPVLVMGAFLFLAKRAGAMDAL